MFELRRGGTKGIAQTTLQTVHLWLVLALVAGCSQASTTVTTPDTPAPDSPSHIVDSEPTADDPLLMWRNVGAQIRSDKSGEVLGITASGPQVVDPLLQSLSQFPQLVELNLEYSEISDDGLKTIATLTQLTTLILTGDEVTDVGLAHLHNLSQLETLDLQFTAVSDAGAARLQKSLPNCRVQR